MTQIEPVSYIYIKTHLYHSISIINIYITGVFHMLRPRPWVVPRLCIPAWLMVSTQLAATIPRKMCRSHGVATPIAACSLGSAGQFVDFLMAWWTTQNFQFQKDPFTSVDEGVTFFGSRIGAHIFFNHLSNFNFTCFGSRCSLDEVGELRLIWWCNALSWQEAAPNRFKQSSPQVDLDMLTLN